MPLTPAERRGGWFYTGGATRGAAELLPHECVDKKRVVDEVTFGESTRFGGQAEKPFEAGALHPSRSHAAFARPEGEGGADGDQGGVYFRTHGMHPGFLSRAAESAEHESRAGVAQGGDVRLPLGIARDAETRRAGSDESERGEAHLESAVQRSECLRAAAVEENRDVLRGGVLTELRHEERTVDAVREPDAVQECERPANGLAVRGDQIERVDSSALLRIVVSRHDAVNSEGGRSEGCLGVGGPQDGADRGRVVDGVDLHAEDVEAGWS